MSYNGSRTDELMRVKPDVPGPDLTDVGIFQMEIRRLHNVEMEWTLVPLVGKCTSAWEVRCKVWGPHLIGITRTYERTYRLVYPNREYKNLEALMYRMCYDIDTGCTHDLWVQKVIEEL